MGPGAENPHSSPSPQQGTKAGRGRGGKAGMGGTGWGASGQAPLWPREARRRGLGGPRGSQVPDPGLASRSLGHGVLGALLGGRLLPSPGWPPTTVAPCARGSLSDCDSTSLLPLLSRHHVSLCISLSRPPPMSLSPLHPSRPRVAASSLSLSHFPFASFLFSCSLSPVPRSLPARSPASLGPAAPGWVKTRPGETFSPVWAPCPGTLLPRDSSRTPTHQRRVAQKGRR